MRKRLLPITLAAFAATASVATAQVLSNPDHDRGPVAGQVKRVQCGAQQQSIVTTDSAQGTTSSVAWAPTPQLATQLALPAGEQRCVKVLLTAETSCTGWAGANNDYCYVRALLDGAPMDPDGAGFQAMDSEDATGSAHAYEWIAKAGPGNHVITLERRVGNPSTVFTTDDLTFDVQLHQ
jgi:hypothetical protein